MSAPNVQPAEELEQGVVSVTPENRDAILEAAAKARQDNTPSGDPHDTSPIELQDLKPTEQTTQPPEETPEETPAPPREEAPEPTIELAEGQIDLTPFTEEFAENGDLSEESRGTIVAALETLFPGQGEDILDGFLIGAQAQSAADVAAAHGIVGGEENYAAMIEWAVDGVDEAQIAAFNSAVAQGGAAAQIAVRGLHAQYLADSGRAPEPGLSVQGGSSSSGVAMIGSRVELSRLQASERYKTDSAYREEVHQRLQASINSGHYRTT